ncbi:GGDEF domain-containing protein [uncultured Abyssibacter sp.]|uniref:GGDEF domain-containing protein n=1 Tax=uncultured Abyssibacter sp. TaxID=2320202 RepID=UPI0032B23E79
MQQHGTSLNWRVWRNSPAWHRTHFLQIDSGQEANFQRSFLHAGRARRLVGIVLLILLVPTIPWYAPSLFQVPRAAFDGVPAPLWWSTLILGLITLFVNRSSRYRSRLIFAISAMNLSAVAYLMAVRVVASDIGFDIPITVPATVVVGFGALAGLTARYNVTFFALVTVGIVVTEFWLVAPQPTVLVDIFAALMICLVSLVGALAVEHAARSAWKDTSALAYRANYDDLTGMANRAYFREQVESLLGVARRDERPVVLAIIDIDHFKSVNDQYGHPVGDEVIRSVAEEVRLRCRRATDVAARLGGEEYAVFFYGADASDAQSMLGELLSRIRALRFHDHLGRPIDLQVTASCGMASVPSGVSATRNGLLMAADRQLYIAKRSGRDRLCWELYTGDRQVHA